MLSIRERFLFSALLLGATVALAGSLRSPGVTPQQLNSRLSGETPPLVIDVRSPGEYSSEHIPGAVSIPAPTINRRLEQIEAAGGNAVLYCNDLRFTKFAEQMLMRSGVTEFYHLEGGLNGWRDAGLELESSLPE
jgi:rhodanese-related sulfurtransferase